MNHVLLPRLSTSAALSRLTYIEHSLRKGSDPDGLVTIDIGTAVTNETGGRRPAESDLSRWRDGVTDLIRNVRPGSAVENALHSMYLGRAISQVINPSRSDAAHDGAWSYLSLMLFPDVLAARWGLGTASDALAKDRWIGRQAGRDRNYLKLAWRRWEILGGVMSETGDPLGEDEFGALLERSAVARDVRLVQAASRAVIGYSGRLGRTAFARRLMRSLTALTGPLQLEVLNEEEMARLVRDVADQIEESASAG